MRVLVTGGAGFIGSHLVDRLLAEGMDVDVVDDLSSGSLANLEEARAAAGCTFHHMDVRAPEVVELCGRLDPQAICHLAAHTDGVESIVDPIFDADVNVLGSLNVFEAARESGADLVYVGSAGSSYATPAALSGRVVFDYLELHARLYGQDWTALSMGEVYGPRQKAGVVAAMVDAIAVGRPVTVSGSVDLLFVDDAVDAVVRAVAKTLGETVPVASGQLVPEADVATMLAAALGADVEVESAPVPPSPQRTDPRRTRELLGWAPWTRLDEGLRIVAEALARRD